MTSRPAHQLLVSSVSLKRSEQFVRSDALSPNAVNRLSMESELEKMNEGNTSAKSIDDKEMVPNEINVESKFTNKKCWKANKVQETKQKMYQSKDEINTNKDKLKSCKSLERMQQEKNLAKLNKQSSLESSLFKRKTMSQAEKHKGWIRMKNILSTRITIQSPRGGQLSRASHSLSSTKSDPGHWSGTNNANRFRLRKNFSSFLYKPFLSTSCSDPVYHQISSFNNSTQGNTIPHYRTIYLTVTSPDGKGQQKLKKFPWRKAKPNHLHPLSKTQPAQRQD